MAEFEDRNGRRWRLSLDVQTLREVKKGTGYDLARMFTRKGLQTLADDPGLLVDVLWVLVQDQRPSDMEPVAFARLFDGDALESATAAIVDAGIDFLPRSRSGLMRQFREKAAEIETAQMNLLQRRLEELTVEDLMAQRSSGESSIG